MSQDAAIARAFREKADELERELVCCDAYDGTGAKSTGSHAICYWAGACVASLRRSADELDPPAGSWLDDEDTREAVQELAKRVNGFLYHGDRLNALVDTVRALREDPELARRVGVA